LAPNNGDGAAAARLDAKLLALLHRNKLRYPLAKLQAKLLLQL